MPQCFIPFSFPGDNMTWNKVVDQSGHCKNNFAAYPWNTDTNKKPDTGRFNILLVVLNSSLILRIKIRSAYTGTWEDPLLQSGSNFTALLVEVYKGGNKGTANNVDQEKTIHTVVVGFNTLGDMARLQWQTWSINKTAHYNNSVKICYSWHSVFTLGSHTLGFISSAGGSWINSQTLSHCVPSLTVYLTIVMTSTVRFMCWPWQKDYNQWH